MKKLLLFCIAVAMSSSAFAQVKPDNIVYQESYARNLEPIQTPTIADLKILSERISYTEKEAFKNYRVSRNLSDVIPLLKTIALNKAAKVHNADVIVGALLDISTDSKGYIEITKDIIFVPNPKDFKGQDIGKKNGLFVLKNEEAIKAKSLSDVNTSQITDDMLDYDDFSHEGSLIIKDDNSLIVFNSCSHYGVVNIINYIKSLDIFKEYPIKAYVGGLHLKGMDVDTNEYIHSECEIKELAKYFTENKIKVYTGHCTGDRAYEILGSQMAKDNLYRLETGIQFNI